jgi:endonuclease-3
LEGKAKMQESGAQKKKRVLRIMQKLRKVYPGVKCALDFSNPLQLLVATILSAQCTDRRVNLVTPALFKKYKTAADYAGADSEELENLIRSTGFYKNKTKNIQGAARVLLAHYGGIIPPRMEDLVTLPGVGRKTANVLLGNAFGIPGLPVDTHMIRINRLLGLTQNRDPVKIEFDLMKVLRPENWVEYSHLIIHHGRARCVARRPDCPHCEINGLCPSADKRREPG